MHGHLIYTYICVFIVALKMESGALLSKALPLTSSLCGHFQSQSILSFQKLGVLVQVSLIVAIFILRLVLSVSPASLRKGQSWEIHVISLACFPDSSWRVENIPQLLYARRTPFIGPCSLGSPVLSQTQSHFLFLQQLPPEAAHSFLGNSPKCRSQRLIP